MLEWTKVPKIARELDFPGDSLEEYLSWYILNGPSCPMVPIDGLSFIGNGPGLVLHRQDSFQAQLFFALPNTSIPEHSHPNVDSYEVHIANCDLHFFVEGDPSIPPEYLFHDRGGLSRWWGRAVRVRPGQRHHLTVGPRGGVFLSLQYWLRGLPSSVDDDWEGKPMEATHENRLALMELLEEGEVDLAKEPI